VNLIALLIFGAMMFGLTYTVNFYVTFEFLDLDPDYMDLDVPARNWSLMSDKL